MEGATDVVFREVIAQIQPQTARPDVFFTEFTNADGLCSPKGYDVTVQRLNYTENQRPLIAQIWGTNPETLQRAAEIARDLKFDGIDINMGCPVRTIIKNGACSALIKTPELAGKIIQAVKAGAGDLPVSVKTRLGFHKIITQEWITFLLQQDLAALTVHGRIAKQMSTGEANWDEIGEAVKLKNQIAPETLLIGNGDVTTYAQAVEKHDRYGVDGVMIGRGIFTNPWVFEKTLGPSSHTKAEYLHLLSHHVQLYAKTWGEGKHFPVMKRFFKVYTREFEGASELRQKLMDCTNSTEVLAILAKE
jgi:nifR3 family TIM-barrel protein